MHYAVKWLVMASAVLNLTGCASLYLDNTTKEVPATAFKKPSSPKPVQLVFDFQTKGVSNARATDYLSAQVTDQVKTSGLFSEVSTSPTPDGRVLSIALNNVPLTDNAFSKGFVTGLTFGLAGSQVSDGYVCTVNYLPGGQGAPITKAARHAIHTVLGAKEGPANGTKMDDIESAVKTMTRQIVSTALNDLSQDPAFQ